MRYCLHITLTATVHLRVAVSEHTIVVECPSRSASNKKKIHFRDIYYGSVSTVILQLVVFSALRVWLCLFCQVDSHLL